MKSIILLGLSFVQINALVLPLKLNLGGNNSPALKSIETCRKFYSFEINFETWKKPEEGIGILYLNSMTRETFGKKALKNLKYIA